MGLIKKSSKGMSERSLKQVGSVGMLVFVGKASRFLVLIAMARLLTPQDFGVFAIFSLALNIAYTFYKNIVTNILVQRKDIDSRDIDTIALTSFVFFRRRVCVFCYCGTTTGGLL